MTPFAYILFLCGGQRGLLCPQNAMALLVGLLTLLNWLTFQFEALYFVERVERQDHIGHCQTIYVAQILMICKTQKPNGSLKLVPHMKCLRATSVVL